MSDDLKFMKVALSLAQKAKGWTLPNPMVGAVLVKDGRVIGEGYHRRFGGPHAEVEAFARASESTKGASLYVTLEPCSHTGKTPPCVEAVLNSGVTRVVVADLDPSEKVHGKGVEALRRAGLSVEVGLLAQEARALNRFFYTFHEKGRPFVSLKMALSLDGKLTEAPGVQTALTGPEAQRYTHGLRHGHEAIVVGAGTVLTDNPHLGVRAVRGRDPLRVILKGERPLPAEALIFRDEHVLVLEEHSIPRILEVLQARGITSVLVEGGQKVAAAFLESGLVDECHFLMAPRLLGAQAVSLVSSRPFRLETPRLRRLGHDLLWVGRPIFEKPTEPKRKT